MSDNKHKNVDLVDKQILKRFNLIKKVGQGAYGIVFKSTDKKTKETVALKKLYDAFCNDTDSQRTFREVMILQELNGHENIIRLFNVIKAENNMDLYLVFEYMEADLYNVIRANILLDIHIKYVTYQILKALKFIHSADIVHRDLKPSNIFINSDCLIKLGDFGLARTLNSNVENKLISKSYNYNKTNNAFEPIVTEYVATRWYRAPEMLIGSPYYSKSVDMWSIGCILLETMTRKPTFPGKSTIEQINLVFNTIGIPSREEYNTVKSNYCLQVDYDRLPINKKIKNISSKNSIKNIIQSNGIYCSNECYNFITKLLVFNPEKRLTVEQALKHPYMKDFHNEEEEYICDRSIVLPLDDNKKFNVDTYRTKLYDEVLKRKIEIRDKLIESLKKSNY